MSRIATLLLVTVLSISIISTSAKKSVGYVYTSEQNPVQSNQDSQGQPINDKDLHLLITHNLGLLDPSVQYEESTKTTISKFGSKDLLSQQKFNYLFLLDTNYADIIKSQKPTSAKKALKHKTAEFSICENDSSSECVLDILFNESREESLIKKLNMATGDQNTEIYFYTTDANTAKSYSNSLLSLQQQKNGELSVFDHKFEKSFKTKVNLEECVNEAISGEYRVSIEKRSITPIGKNQNQPKITLSEDKNEVFVAFLQDVCSINSIGKLIRRDKQPSLFTFYLTSFVGLESVLPTDQITVVQNLFNVVYYQFVGKVKKYYTDTEISGQVLILSQENTLSKIYENAPIVENKASPTQFVQLRKLQESQSSTKITADQTTDLIYRSVLIGFVLLNLWVWIEMFQMGYAKDSIVYAKFSTADYLRK